jgi:hypothetical protein
MIYRHTKIQLDIANFLATDCLNYLNEQLELEDDPQVHVADVAFSLLLYALRTHPNRVGLAQAITAAIASDATDSYDCPTCFDYGVIDEDDGDTVREVDCPDCGK